MKKFSELGLGSEVLKAVTALGFEEPTLIQQQAIPLLLNDNSDFIGLAQTGTGKTAAFGLPLIEKVDFQNRNTQALILAPTRELCVQISEDLMRYSKFIKDTNIVPVYGGAAISNQIRLLRKGAQIIVATPGRLLDLIDRQAVSLKDVQFVVLDEADEMLNMGFQEDIDSILSTTPKDKNIWLFSATMPAEVRRISKNYMKDPQELTIGKQNSSADNLEHFYYVIHERDRYTALRRILDSLPEVFGVVFCRTKIDTQQVAENLIRDGYNADSLHGDLSQQQRDKVMNRYRNRSLQVLVATDVAARGIDVRDITHVIHYHLPDEAENYTHRSGRTARAGKSGQSIALINTREQEKIRQIERKINKKFHLSRIPDAMTIGEQQLVHFIRKIRTVEVMENEIEKFLPVVHQELDAFSREDLIKHILSLEFNRFLEDYRNAPDLNVDLAHKGQHNSDRYRSQGPRLFINQGSVDGFDPGSMLAYVLNLSGLSKSDIGKIDIKPVYSFLEVENPENMQKIIQAITGEFHRGRPVRAEISGPGEKKDRKKSFNKDGNKFGKASEGSYRKEYSAKPRREYASKGEKKEGFSGGGAKKERRGWSEKSGSGSGSKSSSSFGKKKGSRSGW